MGLGIKLYRHPQGPGQGLKAAFGNMVVIVAIHTFQMHTGSRIHGKGLMEFLEQFSVEIADLGLRKLNLPDQIGTV